MKQKTRVDFDFALGIITAWTFDGYDRSKMSIMLIYVYLNIRLGF